MRYLIYCFVFIGIVVYQLDFLSEKAYQIRGRAVFRRNLKAILLQNSPMEYKGLRRNIYDLISATGTGRLFPRPEDFIIISGSLFIVSFTVLLGANIGAIGLAAALFLGAMPYLILRLKLHRQRVEMSTKGEVFINEIINNYRLCQCNIGEALDMSANNLSQEGHISTLLRELSHRLRTALTGSDAIGALKLFTYAIGTNWSKIFAINLIYAHEEGRDISMGLRELRLAIVESKKVARYSRRENNDSRLLIKFLGPTAYVLTVFCALFYFDFSIVKFIKYQFFTHIGLKWMMIMIVTYAMALIIYLFISEEKCDV